MRDYLMLTSVVSRSAGLMKGTSTSSSAGFISKANEILGGNFIVVGRVGQVRLNDVYVGGNDRDDPWDGLRDE